MVFWELLFPAVLPREMWSRGGPVFASRPWLQNTRNDRAGPALESVFKLEPTWRDTAPSHSAPGGSNPSGSVRTRETCRSEIPPGGSIPSRLVLGTTLPSFGG